MTIKIEQTIRYKGVSALAKSTGYSATHISRVLHGKLVPKADLARKLARLGVSLAERKEQV